MSMINSELVAERVYADWHGENTPDLIMGIKKSIDEARVEALEDKP